MTRINSIIRQTNFVDSFCSKKLSDTELRLFNVKEGRVRLRDRIADLFSKKNLSESDFVTKHNNLRHLYSSLQLTNDQKELGEKNLKRLVKLSMPKEGSIPSSIPGPVYEGW